MSDSEENTSEDVTATNKVNKKRKLTVVQSAKLDKPATPLARQKKGQTPHSKGNQLKKKKTESNDEDEDDSDEEEDGEEDEEEDEEAQSAAKKSQYATPSTDSIKDDAARKANRDNRTLFVKNLPSNCSVKLIKAISPGVKQVRMRTVFARVEKERVPIVYAYLEFANEEAAEANYHVLSESTIKGNKLLVDYVGSKSSFISNKMKTEPDKSDPQRLYVTSLPDRTTEEELRKLFPNATDIDIPRRKKDKKLFGYGFVGFPSAELAKEAHDNSQGLKLRDSNLVVLFARKRKEKRNAKAGNRKPKPVTGDAKTGPVSTGKTPDEDDDDDDDDE